MRPVTLLPLLLTLAACQKKVSNGPAQRPSDVRILSQTFSGIDRDTAEPVFNRKIDALKACYKKGLAQNPKMSGVVKVQVKANTNNDPYEVTISEDSKAPKIHTCIRNAYKDMKVPQVGSAGGTVDIRIKFGR